MPIFLDFNEYIKMQLVIAKQGELLAKIKKPFRHNHQQQIQEATKDTRSLQEIDEAFAKDDKARIVDVKIAEDGSTRLYLGGHPEPVRTYPDENTVKLVSQYKKFVPIFLKSFNKMGWVRRVISVIALQSSFDALDDYFKNIFESNQALLKDEHYSQPIKELRRVLKGKMPHNIAEGIALILEYDSAYRYRFQDIVVEYNRNNRITKELPRLLELLASREKTDYQAMKLKWTRIKQIMIIALLISSRLRRVLKEILDELNLDEIRFSKEDLYWVNNNGTYGYRGIPLEVRRAENKLKYNL